VLPNIAVKLVALLIVFESFRIRVLRPVTLTRIFVVLFSPSLLASLINFVV